MLYNMIFYNILYNIIFYIESVFYIRSRRSVVLNLRIATEGARDLGVDGHVCELHLALMPFAELLVR